MARMIMRLNQVGRKHIGRKFYTVYKTTPAYIKDALEALRGDYKEVKEPVTKKGVTIILVRSSRH